MVSCNICYAYPNEPEGFRNFVWGESIQSVKYKYPDLAYVEKHGLVDNYFASNPMSELGRFKLEPFFIVLFYENKLCGVQAFLTADEYHISSRKGLQFLQYLNDLYGQPTSTDYRGDESTSAGAAQTYTWLGGKTSIMFVMSYNTANNKKECLNSIRIMSTQSMTEQLNRIKSDKQREMKKGW